jgi:pyruvate, orthophosphate dikinase
VRADKVYLFEIQDINDIECRLGLPVPPGFIITTDTCTDFFNGTTTMPAHLIDSWKYSIGQMEKITGKTFGISTESPPDAMPLLFSVRSGAVVDMPR